MTQVRLTTSIREQLVDITADVGAVVSASGAGAGVAHVFSMHTTAGLTVNENADPDVGEDMLSGLARVAPLHAGWHHAEGNSDAHLKAALVGSSVTVPVRGGRLALGTWQGIYFCEFDGPRSRIVTVTVIPA